MQNRIIVVKDLVDLLSPENLSFLRFALCMYTQADGKLGIVAMSGMIDGDGECSTLLPHQCYDY